MDGGGVGVSVSIAEICRELEKLAPPCLAENWDNVGLTVGKKTQEVKRVLVALDVTEDVIKEAVAKQAELIVTHHPMILFQKIKNVTTDTPLGRKLFDLIENGIAAYAMHTNLDIAKGGTNDVLATLCGLEHVTILEETSAEPLQKIVVYVPKDQEEMVRNAMCQGGAGHIGAYSHCTFGTEGKGTFLPLEGTNPYLGTQGVLEQVQEVRLETIAPKPKVPVIIAKMKEVHPYEEVAYDIYDVAQKGTFEGIGRIGTLKEPISFRAFAQRVKEKLGLSTMGLVGNPEKMVQCVGLCTGSGASFLQQAKEQGADCYITGDMKFHEAQEALEMGLCVMDATHYASEVLIVPVLQQYLQEKSDALGWEIEVVCSAVNGQTFWHI